MATLNTKAINEMLKEIPPIPSGGWKCADCGTEILVGNLVGKRRKDRKVVCSK